MEKLSELPNIGKIMEKRLAAVGICDVAALLEIGSKGAFMKLREFEGDTCFSSLCCLEGAVQGMRWHNLSKEVKEDLKKYFESFK